MSFDSTADAARGAAAGAGRTLVVGLGNPVLGDDGVGWRVLDALPEDIAGPGTTVEVERLAVGGLTLMERLVGFDRAILVDALVTGRAVPGTVATFPLADLPARTAAHLDSAHDTPIVAALQAGRALGARIPTDIVVVGIEAERVDKFGERLSAPVAAAVPVAVDQVLALLEDRGGGTP